jgi:membrane associated rhomboid family serine protease
MFAPQPVFHLLANMLGAICFGLPVGLLAGVLTLLLFPLKRLVGSAATVSDVWRAIVATIGWALDRLLLFSLRLLWFFLRFPSMLVWTIVSCVWTIVAAVAGCIGGCLERCCVCFRDLRDCCVQWLRHGECCIFRVLPDQL